jgi:hypothetical protein
MYRAAGSNRYSLDFFRYFNPGKASGEWLFVNVRMAEGAAAENLTVWGNHIPLISIVFPACIIVEHGYLKAIKVGSHLLYLHRSYVCFPCVSHPRQQQKQKKNLKDSQ